MNPQHRITLRAVDIKRQMGRQRLHGRQVLGCIGKQGFAVQMGKYGEELVGGLRGGWGILTVFDHGKPLV